MFHHLFLSINNIFQIWWTLTDLPFASTSVNWFLKTYLKKYLPYLCLWFKMSQWEIFLGVFRTGGAMEEILPLLWWHDAAVSLEASYGHTCLPTWKSQLVVGVNLAQNSVWRQWKRRSWLFPGMRSPACFDSCFLEFCLASSSERVFMYPSSKFPFV